MYYKAVPCSNGEVSTTNSCIKDFCFLRTYYDDSQAGASLPSPHTEGDFCASSEAVPVAVS
jgi:hypothetical protein